ncbi:MAG: UvrD-helicase domain-containing protein [bacterium]|nr:UvrD-helicase domain-containing protein [bacterium]
MVNAIDQARRIQLKASRPDRSVVLRAAAGSGKTTALVNRFLRLCLERTTARAAPGTILAVTFTRKAAVEIQERLRREARQLALAAPDERALRLAAIFGDRERGAPDEQEVAAAGALYEQLLADTSGLNLGTIHSFCQVVLGRFAREAGLDPTFGVLEDPHDLHDEAFDLLVGEIAQDPLLADAARRLGAHPDSLRNTLQVCLDEGMRLERWLQAARGDDEATRAAHRRAPRTEALPALEADLRRHLFPGLADTDGNLHARLGGQLAAALGAFAQELPAVVRAGIDTFPGKSGANLDELAAAAAALAAGWDPSVDAARAEAAANRLGADVAALLLTKDNKVRSYTRSGGAEFKAEFRALIATQALPVFTLLMDITRLELLAENVALLRLGLRLRDLVAELKRRDRVVDFQDLEDMASGLLAGPGRAQELQYRLDDAIQHILVDEFQDTNINQWDLLEPFVSEFLAGGGDRTRTVFLVGDVKQSIYGFRGAWPRLFGEVERQMEDYDCDVLALPTNFRSRRAIVEGVGELFNAPPLAGRLEPEEQLGLRQAWARTDRPGTFIIHAPFPDPDDPESAGAGGGEQAAARAAAAMVRSMRDTHELVYDAHLKAERPLQWRDVLVLARFRTDFALYERAFREAGIPFLPPGRGMLAASREVRDLVALLRWLAWPDDNVALATVLRSPIVRLDQGALQALLSQRGVMQKRDDGGWREPRALWQALRASTDPQVAAVATQLSEWRRKLDFETCHDLLRRIARDVDLPRRYQVALGEQARFNLERLYDLALGGDVLGTPTARRLADMIERAAARGTQEEAPLPSDGEGRVRFLTVHGAKGLEAPVVLLVDADHKSQRRTAQVCLDADARHPALLLATTARQRRGYEFPEGVEAPADPLAAAVRDAEGRDEAEQAHLLYVALTRARDRLHVLGGDRAGSGSREHRSPLRDLREAAVGAAAAVAADWAVEAPAADDDALHREGGNGPGVPGPARQPHEPPPAPATWQPPVRRPRFALVRPSAAADDPRHDRRDAADPEDAAAAEASRVDDARPDDDAREGQGSAPDAGVDVRPARVAAAGALPPGVSPAEHGDRVHRLLQAACLAGVMPPGTGPAHDEATAVFAAPPLARVFRPQAGAFARSEVPVIARRAAARGAPSVEQRITGVIDRLVVGPDGVDIIDYKTNRGAADPAQRAWLIDHYRPQLAAYREVLKLLHPGLPVRTWLLFTDPALPHDQRLHEVT